MEELPFKPQHIVEIARWRAKHQGDRLAYTFLLDGDEKEEQFTYRELDRRARLIASWLQSRVQAGESVLLLFDQGLDFISAFYGCLYAGVIAVPAYPPERNKRLRRLKAVVQDSQAKLALTTTDIINRFQQSKDRELSLPWYAIDRFPAELDKKWQERAIDPDMITYLQYSSGSTGNPKGIQVTHRNLLHNSELIRRRLQHTPQDVSVSWLPIFHDLGLIGCVIQPMYVGFHAVSLSPYVYVVNPYLWLKAIHRFRGTTTCSPNFGFDLCVRKITPEQRAQLDLSSWRVAVNCAEPVRQETLERFTQTFAAQGFRHEAHYPMYGMAETTLYITGGRVDQAPRYLTVSKQALSQGRIKTSLTAEEEGQTFVSCGTFGEGFEGKIVNPQTLIECQENEVGEIWVKGPSVAQGYWQRPKQTREDFGAYLEDEGPFLRTGDLAFCVNGEIYLAGRWKDLIIIRGRNHYPQDIEQTVEMVSDHLRPGCGAAFSVDMDNEESLVVVQEVRKHASEEELALLAQQIYRRIAEEHGVRLSELLLIPEDHVKKTSSGKIERRACKKAYLDGDFSVLYRQKWSATTDDEVVPHEEERLPAQIMQLIHSYTGQEIGYETLAMESFHSLGIDSLQVLQIKFFLEKQLQRSLPMELFLTDLPVSEVVSQVQQHQKLVQMNKRLSKRESFPLSRAQKALWSLQQTAPDNHAYHLNFAVEITEPLQRETVHHACQLLWERHPALRIVFSQDEQGVPFQSVQQDVAVDFAHLWLNHPSSEEMEKRVCQEAYQLFDLEKGPLFRVRLFQTDQRRILLFSMHHLISDLWSFSYLLTEWEQIYRTLIGGKTPSFKESTVGYADYVLQQEERLQGERGEALSAYWKKQLEGEIPVLALPHDRQRPSKQSFQGRKVYRRLHSEQMQRLKELAQHYQVTPYVLMLAIYQLFLARYSGQQEILVASPTAGRESVQWANVIGYFAQPVVIRARLPEQQNFAQWLSKLKKQVHGAFAHQEFSLLDLLELKRLRRESNLPPLFQTMFVYEQTPLLEKALPAMAVGIPGISFVCGEMEMASYSIPEMAAPVDISLMFAELEEGAAFCFQYDTALFYPSTVERWADNLLHLIDEIITDPEKPLVSYQVITEKEKQWLLHQASDSVQKITAHQTLVDLFAAQAKTTPHASALRTEERVWSYQELNERADRVATFLDHLGVGSGRLVGILMDRSWEMIVSLLAVLKVGAAYVPLDPLYPKERLRYMIHDASLQLMITSSRIANRLVDESIATLILDKQWEQIAQQKVVSRSHPISANELAYVIYTSGSTGQPKGVAIEHRNAMAMIEWAQGVFSADELAGTLCSTSICFDLSIFELFVPWSVGGCAILVDDGLALAHSVHREKVTLLNTVPSVAMELLRSKAIPKSVRVINLAGEPLSRSLVQQVYEQTAAEKVYNLYGPSECTTYSTYALVDREHMDAPTIGRPIAGTQAYLLNEQLQLVPQGVPGELYLGGAGVARGYLGKQELTQERFIEHPEWGRLYRTGDRVRWNQKGELVFLGRLDHQVKIRGFRIECGEVEAAIGRYSAVKQAIVLAKGQQLIAYIVWHKQADGEIPSLVNFLRSIVPHYMVPNQIVTLKEMPLTANGKIDRKALLSLEPTQEHKPVKLPQHPIEIALFRMWSQLLRCEKLGIETNFFHVGGHSLLATQLLALIKRKWGISLQVKDLFAFPTIEQLAKRIAAGQKEVDEPIKKRDPWLDQVPLSYTQQRLWFLDRFIQEKPDVYHVPAAFRLTGTIDLSVLQWSLQQVVARHEVLRTVLVDREGRGEQVVLDLKRIPIQIKEVHFPTLKSAEREKRIYDYCQQQIAIPFVLDKGPLWRLSLLRCSSNEAVLLLVIHHMIADGWAIQLFMRDLLAFYHAYPQAAAAELPPLPVQYADYALWERQKRPEERLERSLAYWREQLGDEVPVLALPTDRSRPPVQSYRGDTYRYSLSSELTASLRRFCQEENVTLFMALMTAWTVLLHRYSGQNDICVGTPVANRQREELEQLIGSFVNTLVLRVKLDPDPTFRQLLQQVREVALDAFAHQEVPFERLLDELNIERDLSISPLFQVMFVLQNAPISLAEHQQELRVKPLSLYGKTAKYDLTLFVTEHDDRLEWVLEYATDLFSRQTVKRMMTHFAHILKQMIDRVEQSVTRFPLLTLAEKEKLTAWNQTPALMPPACSLVGWFEEQVFKMPERIALEDLTGRYTFRQLNQRANQLARHLRSLGIQKESLVGICLSRTREMVVAMLAVLKAGGAYVPFDPTYPEERIRYMVQDAEVRVILTEQAYTNHFSTGPTLVIVDQDEPAWADEPVNNLGVPVQAEQLAYVIYTSGSTGRPKGVMIEHRSVLALLAWAKEEYSEEDITGMLASTSICFDLSIFEIFFPLCCGGRILLAENALQLPELPYRDQVSLINTVPSAIAELLRKEAIPEQTRVVNLAGEPLAQRLVEQIYALGTVDRVYNLYGPSEDTTYSTCVRMKKKMDHSPSIGYPIAGTKVHVLDRHMQPVPIGVVGECYLSGAGLSRGYLKRPELTAERFVYLPTGERVYRTGDLVRYRPNGELEFLGRTDFQVKIRGFRIELGEIEERLRRHPQVEEAVVIPYEGTSGKQLVAYLQVKQKQEDFVEVNYRAYLQRYLPTYMIPNVFQMLEKVPLTPNGKIDRRRLPKSQLQTSPNKQMKQKRGPVNEPEAVLSAAWEQVLGLTSISRDDHFFELGGDSILILQVIAKCKSRGWRLTPQQFFAYPRIAQLARVMQKIDCTNHEAHKVSGRLHLTPIQHWFFEQQVPNPHNWNQSMLFRLADEIDPQRLQQAFMQLVDHHDALRLRFWQTDVWQAEFRGQEEEAFFTYEQRNGDPQSQLQELHRELEDSLRIDQGPLLRVKVVEFPERDETYLIWVIHHLVVDGVSWRILLSDLEQAYRSLQAGHEIQLPAKTTSYQQWGETLYKAAKTKKQIAEREYWLRQQASTSLPLDYSMGMNTDTMVDTVNVSCTEEESRLLLTEVPKHYRAKLMEVFLAAFSDAYFAWTGQTQLLVHLESHGREWPDEQVDLSQTVGWFTSIYPVLLTADRNQRLGQTLSLIKDCLRQVPNHGIGYGVLRYLAQDQAIQAMPEAAISFNYLGQFDQLQNHSQLIDQVIGFYGPSYRQESKRAHLIDVTGMIVAGNMQWSWLYSRSLFARETIQRFADLYLQALRRFVEQHKKPDLHSFNPSDFPQARLDRSELSKVLSKISQRKD